jgi:hypothetical protein
MAEQGNRAPFINEREDFDQKMEQLDQCIEAVGMLEADFQRGLDESTVTQEQWTRYNAFHEKNKAHVAGVAPYHTPYSVEHKCWQKYVMPTITKDEELNEMMCHLGTLQLDLSAIPFR